MNSDWRKIKDAWDCFASDKGLELEVEEINGIGSKMDKYRIHSVDDNGKFEYRTKFLKAGTAFDIRETYCTFLLDKEVPEPLEYLFQKRFLFNKKTPSKHLELNELADGLTKELRPRKIELKGRSVEMEFPYLFETVDQFQTCETFRTEVVKKIKTATNNR